ncbi:polypeptide N-acetylgalactosaminyltransferase 14-like isoform X2 [Betta splendens]|uniref:Polypeptide N-acetylgalactosaminyltransferase 14-like isoform X2 n=1 Tax=Betta splendens TaxID=158456 RepID=A0A9W2XLE2_BETSP|nr:polypeptide N-acetylgalactosaminyltransferase 14-like isoform X2 [Betta splendens]XP_055362499.1 polypeptide N-acetylgalactosaminyltransferase 14-like isoform X2 [Betta splendens]
MKRLCRKLAVAVAVLVWLGALVYLLVLSRRKLPELGTGAGAAAGGGGGGDAANNQISDAEWEDMLEGFDERSYLNARRWRPGDDPYTLYAFNQRESERIPSNRALRDTRHHRQRWGHSPVSAAQTKALVGGNGQSETRRQTWRRADRVGCHSNSSGGGSSALLCWLSVKGFGGNRTSAL